MIVLAIDTSSAVGSTAIVRDGEPLQTSTLTSLPGHSETLLYSLSRMFDAARLSISDVDLLATGIGPGSFTGLRVGLAAMKGLHLSTGKPLLGVSSLLALAMNVMTREAAGPGDLGFGAKSLPVCVAIDARRGDVFAAVYRFVPPSAGSSLIPFPSAVLPEHMTRPPDLIDGLAGLGEPVVCLGDAFPSPSTGPDPKFQVPSSKSQIPLMPFMLVHSGEALHFPSAVHVAAIALERLSKGEADNAAALEPRYVRPVAFKTV